MSKTLVIRENGALPRPLRPHTRPCFVLLCFPSAALLPVHVAQLLAITLLTMHMMLHVCFQQSIATGPFPSLPAPLQPLVPTSLQACTLAEP